MGHVKFQILHQEFDGAAIAISIFLPKKNLRLNGLIEVYDLNKKWN